MKTITIFYLSHCPYCRRAMDALKELKDESFPLEGIKLEWIEESEQPEVADRYDYYRVPSLFYGTKKLYECNPSDDYAAIKENIARALRTVSAF